MEEESGGRVLLNMNGCESEDVFSASEEMVRFLGVDGVVVVLFVVFAHFIQ